MSTRTSKIYVDNSNFIELCSDIADAGVSRLFGDDGYEDDGFGGTKYTEEAQDWFNEEYDMIEYQINQKLGVYSDTDIDLNP